MRTITETAAAGSTSAGSIAVVPGNRLGGMQSRMSLKDFMLKFYSNIQNGHKYIPLPNLEGAISSITESAEYPYQLGDATSRFKNMEKQGKYDPADVISYGIQDDTDNMMIVTIPIQQAEEFERRVAQALADVLDYKKTGKGENKTLAELLYELKDEFTVIHAQFPVIPKDAVYNADEITTLPEAQEGEATANDFGDEDMGADMGDEDMSADMGDEDMGDEDMDADMGDDFDETPDKESLLVSVLGMLKSQNEKETAQANAKAERAKAKQAEIALKSSKKEMQSQEKMVAVQAEMDAEKEKEKRAKEMANLAKFNYKKRKHMGEGFSPMFRSAVLEAIGLNPEEEPEEEEVTDDTDSPLALNRDKQNIIKKYQPSRLDSPEKAKFKQAQMRNELSVLNDRLRKSQAQDRYNKGVRQRQRAQSMADRNNQQRANAQQSTQGQPQ